MKKDILQTLKVTAIALALTLGVNYVMAWTGPTQAPPSGNTATPINIGTTDQVKNGGLGINSLSVFGNSSLTGNVGIGIGVTNPQNKIDIKTTSILTGISFNGKPVLSGYQGDGWLRLDDSKSFPNGVITSGKLRVDGDIQVGGKTVIDNNAGWHRTYGNTGWYNATYNGGFFMQDSSWVRSYKDKGIYTGGVIKSGLEIHSPKYCDSNGNNCTAAANLGGGVGNTCYTTSFSVGAGAGYSAWWGCSAGYSIVKLHTRANNYSYEIIGAKCCK